VSDIPTLSALVGETQEGVAGLARSMAALMADPQSKAADRRLPTMGRRMGVVTAVNTLPLLPLTADVEVNGTVIPGCSPQSTYRPQVGDLVWLEFLGADPHVSPPLTTYANRVWNLLTLNSPWVPMNDAGWTLDPAYWRDPLGIVHLIGSAKSGAHNTVIATLPAGYRPPGNSGFAVYCYDAGIAPAVGHVAISAVGNLLYLGPATPAHVALDGITFRID
jgi:hypothetical protein